MKILMTFCCLLWLTVLSSCEKDCKHAEIENGTYKGTFQRTTSGNGNVSAVTLVFSNGNYSGTSDQLKYPAICNGKFSMIKKGEINFDNSCIWTAEFDWTLILNGTYQYKITADSLLISRDYGAGSKDIYRLKRNF